MKPFNLERAKAGDPVQARDGRKARILCLDMKNDEYPIIAIVTNNDGTENVFSFTENGTYYDFDNKDSIYLVMDNKTVTKFVNVYKHGLTGDLITSGVFNTIEEAKAGAKSEPDGFLYTQELSWEE